jgi:hypothetical protein
VDDFIHTTNGPVYKIIAIPFTHQPFVGLPIPVLCEIAPSMALAEYKLRQQEFGVCPASKTVTRVDVRNMEPPLAGDTFTHKRQSRGAKAIPYPDILRESIPALSLVVCRPRLMPHANPFLVRFRAIGQSLCLK